MSQYSDRSFSDFHNIHDVDEGEISWDEDDIKSEDGDVRPPPLQPSPRNVRSTPKRQSPRDTGPEPQFVMPSIGGNSQPRQRTGVRKTSQAEPLRDPRSRTISARSTPKRAKFRDDVDRDTIPFADRILGVFLGLFGGLFEILRDTVKLLKTPISYGLAFYLLMVLTQLASNLFTNSIYAALSPVCRVPGVGFLNLPICRPYGSNTPTLPGGAVPDPEFDSLMNVQGQFETIMEETSISLTLPADMKRSETYLRDLRQVVRFSTLPSKNELMHEFDGFIETARIASYDLQKFHSHVGRGVDIVLSTARWTSRVLDDISRDDQQQRGLIPAFISDTLLAPFKPLKFTEARALDQYIQHSHVISGEIEKLVEEAQTLLHVLQNLEDRLEVIHAVALRDNIHVQDKRDEILADIWTHFGLNKAKQRKLDTQMNLLRHVSEYRKLAIKHVANTIVKLQEMGTELEELRTRVGSAAVLKEAGMTHVPLSVHIENIQLGVERLEIGRQKVRELEQKHTRRILDRNEADAAAGEIKFIDS